MKLVGQDALTPVRTLPLPPWPVFGPEEIEAVEQVLRSGRVNYWTGEACRQFEQEFAQLAGCKHAVALANGTVALELALQALQIGAGDEVIVTCRSFIASASCCVTRGARPVFVDVDRRSQNITADTIRPAITPRTRAIIVVHLAGWPCDMDPIVDLARRHGLAVIEDCAQAHGARYKGRPVGSLGDVAAFSFCQDKILTTGGEGGMLTTNDSALWEKAWSYKDHGKNWDAVYHGDPRAVFRWLHGSIGTNWRMTEMQAAIGRSMLGKLAGWLAARKRHASQLTELLADEPALRLEIPPADTEHAYYKYYAFLRPDFLADGWDRDAVARAIQAEGIPCGSGSCPEIYREEAFAGSAFVPAEPMRVAAELGRTSLMFLVHPTLSESDIADTARAIRKVLHRATRKGTVPLAA